MASCSFMRIFFTNKASMYATERKQQQRLKGMPVHYFYSFICIPEMVHVGNHIVVDSAYLKLFMSVSEGETTRYIL